MLKAKTFLMRRSSINSWQLPVGSQAPAFRKAFTIQEPLTANYLLQTVLRNLQP